LRLHPAVSSEEALDWLRQQALARWSEISPELERALETLARAMAAVSEVDLPEDVEP